MRIRRRVGTRELDASQAFEAMDAMHELSTHMVDFLDPTLQEHFHEAPADHRTRLDQLDPSTFRQAPQCEHRRTTDPVLLRAILKLRDGAGGDYWWVECSACDCGWQVPHYATESVG
jgi:hypothetical protein